MNSFIKSSYLSSVYLFLYLPIIVVVWFSFNNAAHSLLWHGFTLQWYTKLAQDPDLATSAIHSLEIGILAATVATVMGLIAAIAFFRYQFIGKRFLNLLILMLIILPDLVLGIALLILFSLSHFPLGFWSLLLSHISFCVPFACITIAGRIANLDRHLIEAGKDLGATEWKLYIYILIPLLLPGIIAAWLLCFTLSLDDVVISYFVSGPDYQILPLQIFSMVRLGVKPEINALSTLLLITTLSIVVICQLLLRKKQ